MTRVSPFLQRIFGAAGLLALCACATTGAAPGEADASPPEPIEPAFTAADILGKGAQEVDSVLGAPALARREGAGEYRRYDLARCALIAILYPDENGVVAVRRLDSAAKRSGVDKPDLDDCLAGGLEAPAAGAPPTS